MVTFTSFESVSFLICLYWLCPVHLKNHMVAHEEHRFACPSCSYRAARKANLEAHISAQHGNNRKAYRCNEPCQYATGYAANLSKHQKLFCKYRRRNDNGNVSSLNQSAAASAVKNMLPERENETATDCNSMPGISAANVTVASNWNVWSAIAVNSFNKSTESSAVQNAVLGQRNTNSLSINH